MLEPLHRVWRRLRPERFLKFCIVGLSGVGVNLGLLWLLTERLGLFYLLSAVFSIEVSILSNFVLNEFWTFRDRRNPGCRGLWKRMLKFNLSCAAGAAINILVLGGLTELLGVYYLLSALFGIGAATLWNYGLSLLWTWKPPKPKTHR